MLIFFNIEKRNASIYLKDKIYLGNSTRVKIEASRDNCILRTTNYGRYSYCKLI